MSNGARPTRADRDRRRRARDRRWQVGVVVVALVVGAVAMFATSPRSLFHADAPVADDGPAAESPLIRTTLWLHQRADSTVDLAALIGAEPRAQQATIVFIPTSTVMEVPALGIQPLTGLLRAGDVTGLSTTVANALGVRIDRTAVVDDSAVSKMFATTPRFEVSVPDTVSIDDSAVTLGPGTSTIPASVAARVVTGVDDAGSLAHFSALQAVLEGWFRALRASTSATTRAAKVPGAAPLVGLAGFGEALQYETLPVVSVDAGATERFEIREPEASRFVAERFAAARLGVNGQRVRVELLNGVGTPGLVQLVANKVVPAGAAVQLSGNAVRFGERTTKVVYYRDRDAPIARTFVRILGAGTVAKGASPVAVVDITIVIGADLAAELKR